MAPDIEWNQLSEQQCEDLITALLTELYPRGRRINGRGGDGGRDYEVPADGGWHRFEVKSWSKEFGKSQRQQLKASLQTTLRAKPVKVTVVVPLDQTPGMVAWLDEQQATTAVPLNWRGRTWLETQVATRPHLIRAFARTSLERTLERLAEYHAEQAALPNGVPDAIERFQRLLACTDETAAHYRFRVETEQGQTILSIIPRTERSLEEHPITFSLDFVFPTNDPCAVAVMDALTKSMDYGDPVTIPSEYVANVRTTLPAGLGKELTGGATVTMGPAVTIPWDKGRVVLVDAAGCTLQQLPVRFTNAGAGRRGFIAEVEDLTGSLWLGFRGPRGPGQGDVQFRFTQGEDAIPADLLGPLRFIEALRTAARLRLLASAQQLFSIQVTPRGNIPSGGLRLVEALARIQEATGVFFALPRELTEQEVEAIVMADTLLRDRQVIGQGAQTTLVVTCQRARQLLEAFPSGQMVLREPDKPFPVLWEPDEPFAIQVAGHQMPLGPVSIHAACARFDAAALRHQLAQQPADPCDHLVELLLTVDPSQGPIIRLVAYRASR